MAQQEPIRVVVEKKGGCFSGCGTALAVLILIALAIKFWYVSVGILVVAVAIGVAHKKEEKKQARRKPGPRDPWLNEVAVSLADLGLTEIARNTGGQLGGVALEGDIALQADRLLVYINLFSDAGRARQAELGLRAIPKIRDAIASGGTAVKAFDCLLYVANGRGGVVDEFRLDEVMRTVGNIGLPPALSVAGVTNPTLAPAAAGPRAEALSGDVLEQLRKLAELRDTGILTQAEFDAKKAELLRRL